MRPRIGITTNTIIKNNDGLTYRSINSNIAYAQHVMNAGGIPLLLPNFPDIATETLATLDGVLFSGGGDINSAYWHEPAHSASGPADDLRDAYEIALLRAALAKDMPILGICRGIQLLAVAMGGDLWQDIPSQCQNCQDHSQSTARHLASHQVIIDQSLLPTEIFLPNHPGKCQLAVNSIHHQAVRNIPDNLRVAGRSSDGIIEALCAPEATFVLAVQWHPEEMAATDPQQAALFKAFVAAAQGKL